MFIPDVNILLAARRTDHPDHAAAYGWLQDHGLGSPIGLADFVLASTLRMLTNPRIFVAPDPAPAATAYVRALLEIPRAHLLHGGREDWTRFLRLVDDLSLTGNDIPDALLAAITLEHHATLITLDRGFGKYVGLRWEHPDRT